MCQTPLSVRHHSGQDVAVGCQPPKFIGLLNLLSVESQPLILTNLIKTTYTCTSLFEASVQKQLIQAHGEASFSLIDKCEKLDWQVWKSWFSLLEADYPWQLSGWRATLTFWHEWVTVIKKSYELAASDNQMTYRITSLLQTFQNIAFLVSLNSSNLLPGNICLSIQTLKSCIHVQNYAQRVSI